MGFRPGDGTVLPFSPAAGAYQLIHLMMAMVTP